MTTVDAGEALLARADDAVLALRAYLAGARVAVLEAVTRDGMVDAALIERGQRAVHGFAWTATVVEGLAQLLAWARRLAREGRLGAGEATLVEIGFAEYLAQILGGLPMSQNEIARPADLGARAPAAALAADKAVAAFLDVGPSAHAAQRSDLAGRLAEGWRPDEGLGDETLDMIRDQFRRFAEERIAPGAHA